ncbi:YhcN/YlaJ family sporulation lipoprotein [Ornithinibacillus sp. 4-3]|uniref:YhcN/YlaJ family sporulation lipoprotein n=1 Tax=Ornithinibacillus sp. 4-3 TaxID=3231488 RepID=A0AB39HUZ4_9BACI
MKLKYIIFCILIITLFTGCRADNEQQNSANEINQQQVRNNTERTTDTGVNNEVANHLSKIASDVPNVNRANSIVIGPYAVVAIDVDGDLDRGRVGTIKYSVSEALQHDPNGKEAIIIADADLPDRFKAMKQKIDEGYPIRGIMDELAAIIGRYMPDYPIKEAPPPEDRDMPEDIPNDDQEKLNQIRNEQIQE